jgi:alkylation response protein AidB-like acyl-CoA dehydrogenase
MAFQAPIAEIAFTLKAIAGLQPAMEAGLFGDLGAETVDAILAEAGRFASEDLAPLNRVGDKIGAKLADGKVTTAPGWRDVYRRWADAGWNGLAAPEAWGGQGLPTLLNTAVNELWNSGAASFAAGPMLTAGAIEALDAHASRELKEKYLPKLVSGEWMATMNLTEPQAGSDLAAIRSRAERAGDGTYRIFGQKIFITYGEHDLTDNIIHMVLAKLPDAPPGTGGISLFLVPKFIPKADGSAGERNDVVCAGIEHKLGLHGSPTCTMIFGDKGSGAVGWLVGEEHRGLAAMFTMMNLARLTVGIQGIGVAARAFDQALAYAHERRQGRAPGAAKGEMSPIVRHPDVQRDLLRMKALTAAARAIAYSCAFAIDLSHRGPAAERARWADRASLLTPIAKAFSTDIGIEVASLGIQVHGGTGYIEETGAAQYLRDARIFAIYEGTNGIQAIDLVTRKLRLADGAAVQSLIDELSAIATEAAQSNRVDLGATGAHLTAAIARLGETTEWLTTALAQDRLTEALAGATPYLRLFGLTAGGTLLAKGALRAAADGAEGQDFAAMARFFAETVIDESAALAATVTGGSEALRLAVPTLYRDGGVAVG